MQQRQPNGLRFSHFACFTLTALVTLFMSCTTTHGPTFEKSEVLERMGNKAETPEWSYGSEAMQSEGGQVFFIQTMTMEGNARPDACMAACELSAKAEFLKHIQTAITTSGQLNDQNLRQDPAYESLTAFLAQGKLSGAATATRYYEKRVESDAVTGERTVKLHCAVKVGVKKADLERQLADALGNGGNKAIREKILEAQKKFIEDVGEQAKTSGAEAVAK